MNNAKTPNILVNVTDLNDEFSEKVYSKFNTINPPNAKDDECVALHGRTQVKVAG